MESIETMKNIDIRTVDKNSLVDIAEIEIDMTKTSKERAEQYVKNIKNPYCFLCDGYAVKLEFSDSSKTMEECFMEYIETIIGHSMRG